MLNHFRTLLLNLSFAGDPTEHIPSSFSAVVLPLSFRSVYNTLFPPDTSRYFKQFLVQNYIHIVKAAGLADELVRLDSRVSYADVGDYFKIYRHSNPAVSNSAYPIFIYGEYSGNKKSNAVYDNFLISQVSNTSTVLVYSTTRKVYLKDGVEFETPDAQAQITLSFTNGVSQEIIIGKTGISFKIAATDFTGSSDKTWEFLVESPFVFPFSDIMEKLKISTIDSLLAAKGSIDTTNYDNLWHTHYNPVYKLAGLLLGYVSRVDKLL